MRKSHADLNTGTGTKMMKHHLMEQFPETKSTLEKAPMQELGRERQVKLAASGLIEEANGAEEDVAEVAEA